jgi:UPF0755 protein
MSTASRLFPSFLVALTVVTTLALGGCGGQDATTEEVEFMIPSGAGFGQITDTLVARNLISSPRLFRGYARLRGHDRQARAGLYRVPADAGWSDILDQLVAGRVVALPLTIPEGFTLRQMAPRLAEATGLPLEVIEERLAEATEAEARWGIPGPGLEGYLFPDTYHFTPGIPLDTVIRVMVGRYRQAWTEERREQAEELGFSEREVMTLASIVQAEARHDHEMPVIAAVFHNRIRLGYPLQADPTVQYALEERQSRLLYSHIEEVGDSPYNTYSNPGLPPGPIGAPGEAAIAATLEPAEVTYLYFVARPDGTHIFTRTLEEHNRARVTARREWQALER